MAWNTPFIKLVGADGTPLEGRSLWSVTPWLFEQGDQPLKSALAGLHARNTVRPNGRSHDVRWRPVEVEKGRAKGVVVEIRPDGPPPPAKRPHPPDAANSGLLDGVIKNIPGIIFRRVLHPDGSLTFDYIGADYERITGYSHEQIQNDPTLLPRSVHPDDVGHWGEALRRSAATLEPCTVDFRFITAHGDIRWFRTSGTPRRLADGTVVWDGISLDITELKQREAELQGAEARFRDVTAATSDWIWETDEDNRFTYFSDRYHEVTGVDPALLLGRRRTDVYNTRLNQEKWRQHFADIEARRPFRDFQFSSEGFIEPIRYYRISGVPVFDERGVFRGYRGAGREVTTEVEMERQLRESERRFRDIVDVASDWIWEQDSDLRFTYISDRLKELTGVDPETHVVGKTREEISVGVNNAEWLGHLEDIEARRPFRNFRYAYTAPSGNVLHAVISGKPIYGEDGTFLGYRGSGADITRQVEAEAEAQKTFRLLSEAVEALKHGFALFDENKHLFLGNQAFRDLFGLAADEDMRSATPEQLLARASSTGVFGDPTATEALAHLLAEVQGRPVELCLADGRWLAISTHRLPSDWIALTQLDITEIKRREAALLDSESRFRGLAEASFEGILVHDDKQVIDVNQTFTRMVGHRADTLDGTELLEILLAAARTSASADQAPIEITVVHPDGGAFPAEVRSRVVPYQGRQAHVVAIRDISERKAAEDCIRHLAHHDALTGLPNRILFADRLEQAMAQSRRSGQRIALLQLDLDHFKDVNDTLGHPAGDALLCEVASRLLRCVRESDTVARLGGDEFAVLLTNLESAHDASRMSQRIIEALRAPLLYLGKLIHTATSVGITIYPDDDEDREQLFKNADIALYSAKANGRSTYSFFVPAMRDRVESRQALEVELRSGICAGEFVFHYQPQIRLSDRRVIGLEALLRWEHPTRGLLGPGEFLQTAEDTGLIVQIGLDLLHSACREARDWLDQGLSFGRIALNLAPAQFKAGQFATVVGDVLAATDLGPHHLEFEVTEGVFLDRATDVVAETLDRLHGMGIQISLDDFGTGYASLAHLKRFPIDRIKIDRSFVRDIGVDPGDTAIVRTVVSLGRSLGLEVVAEGVETHEQAAFLHRQGCDAAQGYLFGRPMSGARIADFLRREQRAEAATDQLVGLVGGG